MTDHKEILHTSRQLHCRDVCEISLWSVENILNQSTAKFGRISNLIEISVGRAPEQVLTSDMTSRCDGWDFLSKEFLDHCLLHLIVSNFTPKLWKETHNMMPQTLPNMGNAREQHEMSSTWAPLDFQGPHEPHSYISHKWHVFSPLANPWAKGYCCT